MEPTFDYDNVDIQIRTVKFRGERWILMEASEQASKVYKKLVSRALKLNDGKLAGIGEEMAEVQSAVVGECLFQTVGNDGTNLLMSGATPMKVPLERINKLPAKVIKEMFNWIKSVSDLDEKEQTPDEIKKAIAELQKKLEKVEGENHPKALLNGTTQNSTSVPNLESHSTS